MLVFSALGIVKTDLLEEIWRKPSAVVVTSVIVDCVLYYCESMWKPGVRPALVEKCSATSAAKSYFIS